MPKQFIKKYLPSRKRIGELKLSYYFGNRINDNRLWVLNRQSVSRATAVGLFCAYMPIPMQMLLAALFAIWMRTNLPVAIMLVWISNPLTWLVVYTPPYLLGLAITGESAISITDITFEVMKQQFGALLIGCLVFGTGLALAGFVLANVIWRMIVANKWSNRKKKNAEKK